MPDYIYRQTKYRNTGIPAGGFRGHGGRQAAAPLKILKKIID